MPNKNPSRFLIIDDDPASNFLCKIAINKSLNNTMEVVAFTGPQSGLEYIESQYMDKPVPTVLLLDINMPILTGWDVLERFQQLPENVRAQFAIYMISSSINMLDKERALNHPLVKDYIEKPISKDKLIQQVLDAKTGHTLAS